MADNAVRSENEEPGPFRNPYPALAAGVALTFGGFLLSRIADGLGQVYFWMAALGLLAAGSSVVIRPRSAIVLALAAFSAFFASLTGRMEDWDSARLVLYVLTVVAGGSAILVLLPWRVNRIVLTVLILAHFGGIAVAVTSPHNSWLSLQLWNYVYRPYLQFSYLSNAYHFYAPEPGPTPLLWFCIEYEPEPDGRRNLRWVKIPSLDQDGIPRRPDGSRLWPNLEFTRRLSLAESANHPGEVPHPTNFQILLQERLKAGERRGIPMSDEMFADSQFRQPRRDDLLYLESYVRHVAQFYPHEKKHLKVIGIKVYKVIHSILSAPQFAQGLEPSDPTSYAPFFMGDYDPDGKLKPAKELLTYYTNVMTQETKTINRDPFLYWLIPIVRKKVEEPDRPFRVLSQAPQFKVINYVKRHAGDIDEGDLP